MMKNKLIAVLIASVFLALYSCTDNDYDLSDIDTNARFKVNDLVVPVNLDAITLDCVLDLDENSKIKKFGDEYAIVEEGTFSSEAIKINTFTADGGEYYSETSIDLIKDNASALSSRKRARAGATLLAHADIPNNATDVKASTDEADHSVISITHIGTEMNIMLSLRFDGLTRFIKKIDIEGLQIQFLKGLELETSIGSYNSETGIITIGDTQTDINHKVEAQFHITGFDAAKAGITLHDGTFSIDSQARVIKGRLAVYSDQIAVSQPVELPNSVGYTLTAVVGYCSVTSFSGKLQYDITGIDIAPIDLGNIPDILTQDGTNLILENPQIYLSLNNPLRQSGYALNAQAGLSLTGNSTYSTASDAIVLSHAQNSFVLSPHAPKTYYAGYEDARHVTFADLGKVVSGGTMPQQIGIEIISPMIPTQQINNFLLNTTLPAVQGSWLLYAPLDLTESSVIKYTKTWDDWQDDDLDNLTVQAAEVTAIFSSDVPLALDVTFTLLGLEGMLSGNATLPANAQNVELTIPLSGSDLSKIYGLTIDARIKGGGATLSPTQKIIVKDLKAKVSGYYDKEL